MKKNIIIATIAVASALILSVSCAKEEATVLENTGNSEIAAFTATIDQEPTKTVLAAGSADNKFKVNWESTDKISIKGAEYTVSSIKDDATKAIFSGNGAIKEDSKYKAIYPSSLYKTDHFELPSIQTYVAGKFNAPMYAESETESLAFKNICGVLCLSLKGDSNDKVKYITVIANEGVCGKFTMGNDAATLSLSSNTNPVEYSRAVSLDCSHVGESAKNKADGGVALSSTPTNFYIYLPPKTYTAGMKILITTTDSRVFEKITTASATIERNNIYTFNNWTLDFKAKPALLSGVFTVGTGKTVQFTKGNLWADGSNALHFETNQWEYVPTQMNAQMDNNHVSHFNWSSTVAKAVGTTNDGDNLFCDENNKQTVDTQEGCYALNKDEWNHLFKERTNYDSKYGCAMLNKNSVRGIIILPDTFNDPYVGFRAFDASTESDPRMTPSYSEAEWIAMESEGAVFLPAAGYCSDSRVSNIFNNCVYWSSSEGEETGTSYSVDYDFNNGDPVSDLIGARSRTFGFCLRLVKDVASGPTTTGTAKRTGDIDVNWVQLWENGPKFAEYNVGAEHNKAEDYGGYYAWGGSQDKVDDHNTSNTGSGNLSGDDDTATNLWGSNWRMPTKAEFDALLANCDVEWTTVGGVSGRKFTGKAEPYSSNSVFLPAAGYCEGGSVDWQDSFGYFWSSTPYGNSSAYSLYFGSSTQGMSPTDRYYGRSVRAVLAK